MVNAVEASRMLIDLVRGGDTIANYAGGCDGSMITLAERELGVVFPPSYRLLVEEFGTWDIAGEEFLGVYRTPASGDQLLGSSAVSLEARRRYGMPSEFIAVMLDGMGGIVVLDSSREDDLGEYPIAIWSPGAMDKVGESFGSYALTLCREAVRRWRE